MMLTWILIAVVAGWVSLSVVAALAVGGSFAAGRRRAAAGVVPIAGRTSPDGPAWDERLVA